MSNPTRVVGKELTNPSGRFIIVGDLHGCYDEAVELLDRCQATARDTVIFLGDLVDRGPDNDKCVELAMRHHCILGNHEQRHLEYDDILKRRGHVNVRIPTHVATRQQLQPKHYDYFRSLPHFIRLPEHNVVCVHAGAFPDRPIEAQELNHLLHIQMIRPYDKWGKLTHNTKSIWPSRVPENEEGWAFWTQFWKGPETLVFGHSVLDKPLVTDNVIGIDGGAVFGRQLHAYILPDKMIITVNGSKDYGKGHRGRATEEELLRGHKIQTYLVHGDVSSFS